MESKQEALSIILKIANEQGYVTFDQIMDCSDDQGLSLTDFDWLSSEVSNKGVIIYDGAPINKQEDNKSEAYDDYAQIDYDQIFERVIALDNSLKPMIDEVRMIVPPQWREIQTLKYLVLEGNSHARKRMIEMHLRLAIKIALQRVELFDADIGDTIADACIGLIIAVDKYNPDKNGPFGPYASMWITQNITRNQSTRRPLMYYPTHKRDIFFSVYPDLKKLGYIHDPVLFDEKHVRELLRKKSIGEDQIDDIILASQPFESLDELNENPDSIDFQQYLIVYDKVEEDVIRTYMERKLKEIMSLLREREREVLELRYGFYGRRPKTLDEVGKKYGLTRERIRQIEMKALRKIRLPIIHALGDYIEINSIEELDKSNE